MRLAAQGERDPPLVVAAVVLVTPWGSDSLPGTGRRRKSLVHELDDDESQPLSPLRGLGEGRGKSAVPLLPLHLLHLIDSPWDQRRSSKQKHSHPSVRDHWL